MLTVICFVAALAVVSADPAIDFDDGTDVCTLSLVNGEILSGCDLVSGVRRDPTLAVKEASPSLKRRWSVGTLGCLRVHARGAQGADQFSGSSEGGGEFGKQAAVRCRSWAARWGMRRRRASRLCRGWVPSRW